MLLYNLHELLMIDVCNKSVHDSLFPVIVIEKTSLINVTRNMGQSPTLGRPGCAQASLDQFLVRVKT